jgi:hypothetical protein
LLSRDRSNAGRTRAAEGNTRRQFFTPFGDLDVPKGFVKNGDAIVLAALKRSVPDLAGKNFQA